MESNRKLFPPPLHAKNLEGPYKIITIIISFHDC